MRKVYYCEDTPCGFFTAVFDAYANENAWITSSSAFQTGLFDEFIRVSENEEKAARVIKKLRSLDKQCLFEIDSILRTAIEDKEQTAFLYAKKIVQAGRAVRRNLTDNDVRKAMDYCQKVGSEVHLLSGFLRFHETSNGTYYAAYAPDNDVTESLMPHFFARLKNIPFVIHDVRRKLAGISNGKEWMITPAKNAEVVYSEVEEEFLGLWRKYYNTVYITARTNTKQMKGYMPVRYWSFMPEKNPNA